MPSTVLGATHICNTGINHLLQKKQKLRGCKSLTPGRWACKNHNQLQSPCFNLHIALTCQRLIFDLCPIVLISDLRFQMPQSALSLSNVTQISFGRSCCQRLACLLLVLFLLNWYPTKIAQRKFSFSLPWALASSAHTCPRGIIQCHILRAPWGN